MKFDICDSKLFQLKQGMEYKPASIAVYRELDAKIELIQKWCYIILCEVNMVVGAVPIFLLSMINFYVLDRGEESFYLPWPMA